MSALGPYLRQKREALREEDPSYSLRQVAERVGIEPSYLSKVERGIGSPPSEETLTRLAVELEEDPDVLLALAGKVSEERFRGLRIFDISDLTRPVQVGAVQTCRGSHTHTIVSGNG